MFRETAAAAGCRGRAVSRRPTVRPRYSQSFGRRRRRRRPIFARRRGHHRRRSDGVLRLPVAGRRQASGLLLRQLPWQRRQRQTDQPVRVQRERWWAKRFAKALCEIVELIAHDSAPCDKLWFVLEVIGVNCGVGIKYFVVILCFGSYNFRFRIYIHHKRYHFYFCLCFIYSGSEKTNCKSYDEVVKRETIWTTFSVNNIEQFGDNPSRFCRKILKRWFSGMVEFFYVFLSETRCMCIHFCMYFRYLPYKD